MSYTRDMEYFLLLAKEKNERLVQENAELRNARTSDIPNGGVEVTEAVVREIYGRAPRAFDWLTHAPNEVSPGGLDSWKELWMRERIARGRLEDELQQVERRDKADWKEVAEQATILQRMVDANRARAENPQPMTLSSGVKFPKSVTQHP